MVGGGAEFWCRSGYVTKCGPVKLRQHTATHCNALQHTATHCNTLGVDGGGEEFGVEVDTLLNVVLSNYGSAIREFRLTLHEEYEDLLHELARGNIHLYV